MRFSGAPRPRSALAPAVALAVALVLMASIGALYAWSVLLVPIERELGSSRAAVSLVFSIAIASFTAAMLLGARLQRRLSPARLALLVGVVAATGSALPVAVNSPSGYLIGLGLGFGVANGLGYGLAIALVQAAFPARPGLMTGVAVATYTAGAAGWAPLLDWGVATFGLQATLLGLACHLLLSAAIGAWALGVTGASLPQPQRGSAGGEATATAAAPRPGVFVILWLGFLFASFAGVLVLSHAAGIVTWLGGDPAAAALAAGLVAIANGVGRVGGGWLTDRAQPRGFLAAGMLAAAFGLALAWAFPSRTAALVAFVAIGLGYGAMAGAYPAVVAKLYGAAAASAVYARVFTSWGLAGLVAPYAAGLLFDRTQSYDAALLASAITALAAAIACRAIPPTPSSAK